MTRAFALALAGAGLLALSACSTSGLAFQQDDRVTITEPRSEAAVAPPFTISWSAPGVRVSPPASGGPGVYFAVFVDRAPLRPGQHLLALVDPACRRRPRCADLAYFADHGVFLTASRSVQVAVLPKKGRHEVTVVLMGQDDRRRGESVFRREIQDARKG